MTRRRTTSVRGNFVSRAFNKGKSPGTRLFSLTNEQVRFLFGKINSENKGLNKDVLWRSRINAQ